MPQTPLTASKIRSHVAAALIVLPLALAAGLSLWPSDAPHISTIVILPAEVRGVDDPQSLTYEITAALMEYCRRIDGLTVLPPPVEPVKDVSAVEGADAVVLAAATVDAGLLQVNIELWSPQNRRVLWRKAYQGPRRLAAEIFQSAGRGLQHALR